MQTTRHHLPIGIIALVPLALLLFGFSWGNFTMESSVRRYRELADATEERIRLLDARSRALQQSIALLSGEGETAGSPSIAVRHFAQKFGSTFERHERAKSQRSALEQRIRAMEEQVHSAGRKIIHLDLSDQTATLIEDGTIRTQYPISSGKRETPTPTGTFRIHSMQKLRISSQFPETPYRMPHYMAFTENGSYGLHALPYLGDKASNSDYWHEARSHIGIPVSHGCVRLLPEDAEALYEWADVGAAVYINA